MVMDKVVRMAKERGVMVGAHPGYPDLLGFGRRKMVLFHYEVKNYVILADCLTDRCGNILVILAGIPHCSMRSDMLKLHSVALGKCSQCSDL